MPPTTKPQTKKKGAEEGKAGKKAVAVAALLLLLFLAVFVDAQQNATRTGNATQPGAPTGGTPDANKALGGFKDIAKWVVLGVRVAIAMAFWTAFAIMVAHFALGKVAPTRFQRLGAFWDGLERAKDIIYGYAWLFLLILAIYTAIGIIANDGRVGPDTVGTVVKWIMIDPIVDLFNELQGGGQRTGP
jgi:hypothetical protein